jgi:hypothetical protein
MRRSLTAVAAVLLISVTTGTSLGQTTITGNTGFSDPFFLYYGFYLPRQAAMAASPPASLVSINALSAARQQQALTERAGLYDPLGGTLEDPFDPTQPFGSRSPRGRGRPRLVASGITNTNINGQGPRGYYNRTLTYYPGLRAGQGIASPNVGITGPTGFGRRGGGGYGGARPGGIGMGGGLPTGMGMPNPYAGMPPGIAMPR